MLTAIGIPFAFLCSVLMMQFTGVSLNTISLFAFVLVTGIMVDDAVIITWKAVCLRPSGRLTAERFLSLVCSRPWLHGWLPVR